MVHFCRLSVVSTSVTEKVATQFSIFNSQFSINKEVDWKDQLGAAFGIDVPSPEQIAEEKQAADNAPRGDALQQQGKRVVHVVIERKGRAGKVATIIVDLHCDDLALKQLASELKQQLGVGGSARGGEILIQGDHRDRVMALLRKRGFTVK